MTYDPAVGFDASSYSRPRANDTEPVLLPWGTIKSQVFRFDGSKFVKAKEVAQAGVATPTTSPAVTMTTTTPTTTPPPPVHTIETRPTQEQLLAHYRADRGVASSRARVDVPFAGNHAMLIGRDIVVLGPTYKNGTSYAYLTLSQFADAGDIQELTVHDSYLVVRGVRHVSAQPAGTFDMELMFLYALRNDVIARVFGIETSRAQGGKRIAGSVQLVSSGRGVDVVAHPGRAQGWTQQTYPFTQDQPGAGAVEPLLLPWGGIPELRYSDNGTTFVKN